MKKLFFFILSMGVMPLLFSQHSVSGTVSAGESGETLPGVNVVLEGQTIGTATDGNGNYTLNLPSGEGTLVFSSLGFQTRKVPVNNQSTLNITLEEDQTELDELIVIGYGAQSKKLVTGATVQVSGEELENQSQTNALQAMQGKTAGVKITSTSGQPGAGFDVIIRGVGTVGNSQPLYVVDGMIVDDITYLNNADIASVDILKDAASAAIYGARGSNGIVIITTKQGQSGKMQITFDSYYGTQSVTNKTDLLNATEYGVIMNEQAINSGKQPYFTNEEINALGEGTNWLDEIMVDNAVTQNYTLGISGGNQNSTYSASASYTQQEGIVGGKEYSDYERYVFRVNSDHKLYKDIIRFGENLTFSYVDNVGIPDEGQYTNNFRGAFNTSPLIPVYDENGEFYDNTDGEFIDGGTQANQYAALVYNNQRVSSSQQLVGNVYMEADILKDLTFRTNLGLTHVTGQGREFLPQYQLSIYSFRDTNSVTQSSYQNISWLLETTLNYQKDFGKHSLNLLAGHSAQHWQESWLNGSNANVPFEGVRYAYLDNATYANGPRMTLGGGGFEDALESYFGRIIYDYEDTYLFNFTMRADGSARFAEGYKWGYFPSVSAGWILTNEPFLEDIQMVDFIKLRGSWGQNGNNRVEPFRYLPPIALNNTNYIFGTTEGQNTPGGYPSRIANPSLVWEASEQIDIGVDAEFLNSRLSVNLDWYQKTTKDWLIQPPAYGTTGAEAPWINGGNMINKGVELVVGWRDSRGDFNYSLSGNIAYNQTDISSIPTADQVIHGEINELWNNAPEFYRAQAGYPIGYFWGYETMGVFQNEGEVSSYTDADGAPIQPNAQPGDLIYRDTNGDGRISEDDKTIIGDPNPDLIYGFNITADYKGFDLMVQTYGVAGNQLVQSYRSPTDPFSNYTSDILDRWHGEGSSNTLPRVTEDGRNFSEFSDIYVQDGDFLRISNITVGYDFADLINSPNIGQFRFYLSGLNLFTFTEYTGMDPEIGYGQTFARGVDVGYYPRPRTLMAGLNVRF